MRVDEFKRLEELFDAAAELPRISDTTIWRRPAAKTPSWWSWSSACSTAVAVLVPAAAALAIALAQGAEYGAY